MLQEKQKRNNVFLPLGYGPQYSYRYCISAKLNELPALIEKYNLEFCASKTLLEEFDIVINRERIKKYLQRETSYYQKLISEFLSMYNIQATYKGSPDLNDDYHIDIVQQTNSVGLVTGDKPLLKWKLPPVQIVSWKDFQLTYPL